jgi:hypothetical protein
LCAPSVSMMARRPPSLNACRALTRTLCITPESCCTCSLARKLEYHSVTLDPHPSSQHAILDPHPTRHKIRTVW